MTPGIRAEGLTLRYGRTVAFDDVSFSLEGGGIHGLLGRNGAGKTSLLSVLAGFRRPSAGTVLVDGTPPFEHAEVVRDVCLVHAFGNEYDTMRARDVLAIAARLRPRWDEAYAEHLVDRFGLRPATRVGALSQGQRSVLGIVVGLAARAPVTAFDEAHLGLDAPTRYAFYDELLRDYVAHPRTVIISSHLIEEVARLLEDVLILDRGGLLLHEDADTLRTRGTSVTGPAAAVDRFVDGMTRLAEQRLGGTKAVTVYGRLDADQVRRARTEGLEIGPVPLQDLFVHLTEPQTAESAGGKRP